MRLANSKNCSSPIKVATQFLNSLGFSFLRRPNFYIPVGVCTSLSYMSFLHSTAFSRLTVVLKIRLKSIIRLHMASKMKMVLARRHNLNIFTAPVETLHVASLQGKTEKPSKVQRAQRDELQEDIHRVARYTLEGFIKNNRIKATRNPCLFAEIHRRQGNPYHRMRNSNLSCHQPSPMTPNAMYKVKLTCTPSASKANRFLQ